MWNKTRWFVAIGLTRAAIGCDPQDIAPLPSPITPPPDGEQLLLSSLTVGEEAERLVAIVGFEHAVTGRGDVKIVNTRTQAGLQYASTDKGTFAATFQARAGDGLEVSFILNGVESEPVAVKVPAVVEKKAGGGPMPPEPGPGPDDDGDNHQASPMEPATDTAFEGSGVDGKRVIPVIVSQGDGTVHLTSDPGFIDPKTWLVIANLSTGAVTTTLSDAYGAVDVWFSGESGDEIAFFSQSTADPSLTSPVVKAQIP